MEVTFIGTGSGKVSLHKFHTSLLLNEKNNNLLIDAGDGVSKALLASNINFESIESILISHTHADHFSGITSLLTQMKIIGRIKSLKIYIHSSFIGFLEKFINVSFLFKETLGFEINILGYIFDKPLKIGDDLFIYPRKNSHISNNANLSGYDWLEFASASFLIQSDSQNILYTADVSSKDDLFLFEDFSIDCMITEAAHITFKEIFDVVDTINPKICYLVHINEDDEELLKNEIDKLSVRSQQKFKFAFDGLRVILP